MDGQLHGGVGVTKLLPPLVSECFHKANTYGQYTDGFGEAILVVGKTRYLEKVALAMTLGQFSGSGVSRSVMVTCPLDVISGMPLS